MSKSDYLENEVLKWCTGQANALDDAVITPYIAAYTATPSDAGGGTEVSGSSYARQSAAGKVAAPSGGSVTSNATVTFPTVTTSGYTVVALALFDASSGGNMLRWQTLGAAIPLNVGDQLTLPSGSITFTES